MAFNPIKVLMKFNCRNRKKLRKLIKEIEKYSDKIETTSLENVCKKFSLNRIIDLTKTIDHLNKKKIRTSSIPILYRCIFESYVDLLILIKDPEYAIHIEFDELDRLHTFKNDKRLKKWLEKDKKSNNYLNDLEGNIDDIKVQINDLKSTSTKYSKKITFEKKLKILDNLESDDTYWGLLYLKYRLLSIFTHNISYDGDDIERSIKASTGSLEFLVKHLHEILCTNQKSSKS